MSKEILQRLADGRTDLVFQYLSEGHSARSTDHTGTPLIICCADHGHVSAISPSSVKANHRRPWGPNLGLFGAAFHGHWQLCEFLIESGELQKGSAALETPTEAELARRKRMRAEG